MKDLSGKMKETKDNATDAETLCIGKKYSFKHSSGNVKESFRESIFRAPSTLPVCPELLKTKIP